MSVNSHPLQTRGRASSDRPHLQPTTEDTGVVQPAQRQTAAAFQLLTRCSFKYLCITGHHNITCRIIYLQISESLLKAREENVSTNTKTITKLFKEETKRNSGWWYSRPL